MINLFLKLNSKSNSFSMLCGILSSFNFNLLKILGPEVDLCGTCCKWEPTYWAGKDLRQNRLSAVCLPDKDLPAFKLQLSLDSTCWIRKSECSVFSLVFQNLATKKQTPNSKNKPDKNVTSFIYVYLLQILCF